METRKIIGLNQKNSGKRSGLKKPGIRGARTPPRETGKRLRAIWAAIALMMAACLPAFAETAWTAECPGGSYETKVQYSFREKQTRDSPETEMEGWIPDGQTAGEWGAWVSAGAVPVSAGLDREVRTEYHPEVRQTAGYSYSRYRYYNSSVGKTYFSYGSNWATSNGYGGEWEYKTVSAAGRLGTYRTYDGVQAYGSSADFWFYETENIQTVSAAYTEYIYRTRERTYHYFRWGEWSEWQDREVTQSDSREVRTRTLYRSTASLTLPSFLTEIEEEAFCGNRSIRNVTLPEQITAIHSRAFADSGLTSINLPASLTWIAEDAFEGSDLKKVEAQKGTYAYRWAVDHDYIRGVRILEEPADRLAVAGDTVYFRVAARNAESYRWSYSLDGGMSWVVLYSESAGTDTLEVTAGTSNIGRIYRCVIIGEDGVALTTRSVRARLADTVPVESIRIAADSELIPTGTQSLLTCVIEPSNARYPSVQWASDDPSTAEVDENGLVTGRKKGSATIRAWIPGTGWEASVTVQVRAEALPMPEVNAWASAPDTCSFSWPAMDGAVSYLIREGYTDRMEEAAERIIPAEEANGKVFTFTGTVDATCYLWVTAINADGDPGETALAKVKLPPLEDVALSAEVTENRTVRLSWKNNPYAAGYEITRTGRDGAAVKWEIPGGSSGYTDTEAAPGNIYTYALCAVAARWDGGQSRTQPSAAEVSIPLVMPRKNYNIVNTGDPSAFLNGWPPSVNGVWKSLAGASHDDGSAEEMWELEPVDGSPDCYRLRVMQYGGLYVNATESGATMQTSGTVFRLISAGGHYCFLTTDGRYALGLGGGVHESYSYQKRIQLYPYDAGNTRMMWDLREKSAALIPSVSSVRLNPGHTTTLSARIDADGNSNQPPLMFSSGNTAVAEVSAGGTVTARAVGTTTITLRTPTGITGRVTVEVTNAAVSGYNATAAANYAMEWSSNESAPLDVGKTNSAVYHRFQGGNSGDGTDCANFVSQCLYAGGLKTGSDWYFTYDREGKRYGNGAWIRVGEMMSMLRNRGYTGISNPSMNDIHVGDVIFINNNTHVMIVTGRGDGWLEYCAHSTDRHCARIWSTSQISCVFNMNGTVN